MGVFRQDPLLIHPGGCFEWSCPELRICLTLCVYHLTPGKGKFLQQSCCQTTQFGRERKGKEREGKISFPSVTRKFPTPEISSRLPAFTEDHLTDPGIETLPLVHRKHRLFWLKKGRAAQPRPFPSYRAQRAKEKQEVEVRLQCWESLRCMRLFESSWWAGLSWEAQNQCHKLEMRVFRTPTHREMGNNRFKHLYFQAEKPLNTCRLLAIPTAVGVTNMVCFGLPLCGLNIFRV